MQVAVIGGGIVGVFSAYFLARAGHEVVVIERYGNVAQENSFGGAGLIAPGFLAPWAAPGMPQKILAHLLKPTAPVFYKPTLNASLWRWARLWMNECELERYRLNKNCMQRLGLYSKSLMRDVCERHDLQYERSIGLLQLFRNQQELELAQPAIELLADSEVDHRLLDPDAVRMLEPALSEHTSLSAALHFPRDEAGNCPLFARQLRSVAQSLGVEFHFNSSVHALTDTGDRVAMHIDGREFHADAVVVAAGMESLRLLSSQSARIPAYPVKTYSATAFIKNFDATPAGIVADECYKTVITRMGSRVRIAGTAEIGSTDAELNTSALRTLAKVGEDWFPDAANYSSATFWCGEQAMLPDGLPILGTISGPSSRSRIYANFGHGTASWTMAAGAGKVLADLISGRTPDIDLEGLTLARYRSSANAAVF